MSATTRDLIREFNVAFDRPANATWTTLTVSERELLGKLLLEETLEYLTKGLGLKLIADIEPDSVFDYANVLIANRGFSAIGVELDEGERVDSTEVIDGLADVNVVIHFCAWWHGFNLDKATSIVNDSNMSKLGSDGKPIINGVTPGYRDMATVAGGEHRIDHNHFDEPGYDDSKPIGKILKSPNFIDPGPRLAQALILGDLDNG